MDYRKMFSSKYVAASDITEGDVKLTITEVKKEEVENVGGKDICPVVYFAETPKGMVLNKTNGKTIAGMYGNEVSNWIGKSISVYDSEVQFGREIVPCVRVRPRAPSSGNGAADKKLEAVA